MDFGNFITLILVLAVIVIILLAIIKVIPEYERGVLFRLGRVQPPKGPGVVFIIPVIDQLTRVDMRTITMDVPTQETITRDNVTIKVNAVCYSKVVDPIAAVVNVANHLQATAQIAQTTLRSVLGQSELDELLSQREQINHQLQQIIDEQTAPWGVKVSIVEVKDLELPSSMQRAMARQAEAEREKRAKVILAEGEMQASEQLANAAHVMATEVGTLQLRYLQTLTEIAAEQNSTIIFPLPIELLRGIISSELPAPQPSRTNGIPPAPPA
jgi:regulator of protease activity HflC (stomatin/prohibitin superfamily)